MYVPNRQFPGRFHLGPQGREEEGPTATSIAGAKVFQAKEKGREMSKRSSLLVKNIQVQVAENMFIVSVASTQFVNVCGVLN